MDYAEMNLGSWSSYLSRFKDLLRPERAVPLGEPEEAVEAAREDDAAKSALESVSGALPDLVFEGYQDWYSYDDEWVLRNLGQVLTEGEEDEILRRLDAGTPDSLGELLHYIEDRLGTWTAVAREEFAQSAGDSAAGTLTGAANTANWQASRTPGTYYYTYSDDRYLYCDLAEASAGEWETLPVREQLATDNAQPWGDSGWFCTPAGEPGLYGGAFVFAPAPDGPWMTEEQATAQLHARAAVSRRYDPVQPVPGHEGWVQGYDTKDAVWKFAQAAGAEPPGDDAAWTTLNAFRADNTEYFAGPGYSESGWVPHQPELPAAAEPSGDDEEYGDELSEDDITSAMAELLEQNPAFIEIPEARRRALILEAMSEMAGQGQ